MSNIVTKTIQAAVEFTSDQIDLIKRTILGSEFTKDELDLFIGQAKRTQLDPFTRQIYATKRGGKMTVQATIDGFRLIAQRSGQYAGQTRPTWFDIEGKEYKVWPKNKGTPYACEVGVLKDGFKEPMFAIAIFDEYAQKSQNGDLGYMWKKMPALMISKVAEALALRKAFPNDLSGLYSSEEMDQATPQVEQTQAQKNVSQIQDSLKENNFDKSAEREVRETEKIEDYVVNFGKHKGKKLLDIQDAELKLYLNWLRDKSEETKKPLSGASKELYEKGTQYLEKLFAERRAEKPNKAAKVENDQMDDGFDMAPMMGSYEEFLDR